MKNFILILTMFICNINVNATVPWSTYFGGTSDDWAQSIATDASGNIYITGTTYSTGLATSGAFQTTFGGSSYDAYITKFNSSGVRQWTTYYGGSGLDESNGIAVDGNGNIYIIGSTTSSSGIATTGSYQSSNGGSGDAFIAKFNSAGSRQWATYFGGSAGESALGISIDTSGNIFITGITSSTSNIATTSTFQTTHGGGTNDGFIAKFNSAGTIQWATYYGGSGSDGGYSIANDRIGNVFISCIVNSSGLASSGAYQTTFGGGNDDVLIVKFNSSGTRQWATYYGGSGDDEGYGIATDTSGNVYVTGGSGTSSGFASSGAYQTTYGGNGDAFILKFNSSGARQWATYFGGSQLEYGWGITTQINGNILITGETSSSSGIATTGASQITYGGATDGFVAKFNSSGSRLWSTFYGGTSTDRGYCITSDTNGNVFIGGESSSSGIATSGAFQTTNGGSYDAITAAFTSNGSLPVQLISFDIIATKEKENLKVLCNWATASEINNNYFSIERSKDGEHFENIGTVKGAGNTNTTITYNFTDETPLTGISYYRLKQTDFDGKYSYSKIKAIDLNVAVSLPISLVYDKEIPIVKFNSTSNNKFTMQLFSLSGTALWSTDNITTVGDNIFPVIANVSSGLYLIKTQLADKVQYFKVWIK